MKFSELLIAAKAKISTPETWTQGVSARNIDDKNINPTSEDAVCWCSIGAMAAITGPCLSKTHNFDRFQSLVSGSIGDSIVHFNDTHTHAEVMEMWDKAIQLAKDEEE